MSFTNLNQRIEYTPDPYCLSKTNIISVILQEDEEVVWTWTTGIDGKSYVSGYTIVKK